MARLTEEARTGSWSGGGGYICTLFWAGGDWAQICGSEHSTSLFTGHAAGQATYFTPGTLPSSEDSRYVGGYYYGTHPVTQGYGNWVEFGEELEYRIRAVGSREFLAQARLQLVENPSAGYRQEVPWYCLPGISNGRVCYEMYNRRGVKAGFATF